MRGASRGLGGSDAGRPVQVGCRALERPAGPPGPAAERGRRNRVDQFACCVVERGDGATVRAGSEPEVRRSRKAGFPCHLHGPAAVLVAPGVPVGALGVQAPRHQCGRDGLQQGQHRGPSASTGCAAVASSAARERSSSTGWANRSTRAMSDRPPRRPARRTRLRVSGTEFPWGSARLSPRLRAGLLGQDRSPRSAARVDHRSAE